MRNCLDNVYHYVLSCLLLMVVCNTVMAADTGLLFWDLGLKSVIATQYQQRLPGSDSLDASLRLASGIPTRRDLFYVNGANRNENRFSVDGFTRTDCFTSLGYMEVSPEIIDSVEITTSAIPVDQDSVMGGIFNATTRSGTNDWHGRVRLDYVNTEWIEDRDIRYYGGLEYEYLIPTLVVDGPIIKDKLWFLASYTFYSYAQDYKTIANYGDEYYNPSNLQTINNETSSNNPYFNIQFKPSLDHRIKLSYHSYKYCRDNFRGDSGDSTPEAFIDLEDINDSWNIDWTWIVNEKIESHVAIGYFSHELSELPKKQSMDPHHAAFYDTFYGQSYNNGAYWSEDQRETMEITADLQWKIDGFYGDHILKFGAGMETSARNLDLKYPGGAQYFIDAEPHGDYYDPSYYTGTYASRSVLMNSNSAETACEVIELFVQDDWQINESIRINLGLRYEMLEYETDSGSSDVAAWSWGDFRADSWLNSDGTPRSTASMKFDDMLAPRLRLDWDVFNDSSWLLHGFYGRYFGRMNHSFPNLFQPFEANQTATYEQQYVGPEWTDMNKDGVPDEDYFFESQNWVTTESSSPLFPNLIDPDLEAEYTDELVFGFSHQLNSTINVGLNYIYRKTNNLIEDVGLFLDEDGNVVWTYQGAVNDSFTGLKPGWDFDPRAPRGSNDGDYVEHIYYITNIDGNDREYTGIELTVEAKDTNWEAKMFYTYSKAEGSTTDGSTGVDGLYPFSGSYDSPGTSKNLHGELPWSATHNLRLTGAYWFNLTDWYEMSFGANLFYNSGYHYSITTQPPYTYDPDDYNDIDDPSTWTGYPPYRSASWHFMDPRGSYELPDHVNVDLSWQHRFTFGAYGEVALIFDIINLFDNQEIIDVDRIYNPRKPDLAGIPNSWEDPRSYHLSLKYSF